MPGVDIRPPSQDQIDRIREMSQIVVGDPDAVLEAVGWPEDRYTASRMLGAIHKVRNQGATPTVADIFDRLDGDALNFYRDNGHQEEPEPMPETKTCTRCGETKVIDEFYEGHGKCKPCFKAHAKEREAKRAAAKPAKKSKTSRESSSSRVSTGGGKDAEPTTATAQADPVAPRSEPDPPLSTEVDGNGWSVLEDPRLSTLRKLEEILRGFDIGASIDDAARLADELVAAFGPKAGDR